MQVSQSVKAAGIIVCLTIIYFMLRGMFAGPATELVATETSEFAVVTSKISPQIWRDEVIVRGRTAAKRKVVVRSETAGAIVQTPAQEGSLVKEGDILCAVEVNARKAQAAEAKAGLQKARLDYNAAVKLNEEGFRSETGVAAAKATLDLAIANVERAEVELSKTKIKAPFDGVFDSRNIEVGDFVKVGDPCGVVIQQSPFLVTGAVSEKHVAKIKAGDRGVARLATGEIVEGLIGLVGSAADPATRTFVVELEIPNDDGLLRDGVTAEFTVFASEREAFKLPRSALVLNDSGVFGVRTVNDQNVVEFVPVVLLGESVDGIWASGLGQNPARLITRGQGFVQAGQTVAIASAEDSNTELQP